MNTALALKANTSDLTGLATTEATNDGISFKSRRNSISSKGANTSD
jgi:hypothetical protein